jgi:hypothetical protein
MKSTYIALLLSASVLVWAPHAASASVLVGSVDASALTTVTSKPTLSGMVFGATKVRVLVRKVGSTNIIYKSKILNVQDYRWEAQVTKKLADGMYTVEVVAPELSQTVVSEVLVVGSPQAAAASPTTVGSLIVAPISLLLSGGVAGQGSTVPIAYLQITNADKNPATIQGFWVKQNGSAPVQTIVGLSVIDDQGMVRGTASGATLFDGQQAFVSGQTVLAPGQMRLFTIKATLSSAATMYTGTQLLLDVVSVHADATTKGMFPLRGTTWTIK